MDYEMSGREDMFLHARGSDGLDEKYHQTFIGRENLSRVRAPFSFALFQHPGKEQKKVSSTFEAKEEKEK